MSGAWPEDKLDVVRAHVSKLTPREREFSSWLFAKTNKQVANTLGGTERTIKAHRQKVMEKMQVQSLATCLPCERSAFWALCRARTISLGDPNALRSLCPIGQ